MKFKTIKLLLFSQLFIFACATPLPISQLVTESDQSRWIAGRQYTQLQGKDMSIGLSYYKNEGNTLIFDVMIDNYSDQEIHIDPTSIEIVSLDQSKHVINRSLAIDPESKLLDYDRRASIQKADLANDASANFVLSATDLATTIAEERDPNLTEKEKDRRFNQRLYWDEQDELATMRKEAYLESLKNTRQYWEEAPIRKTDMGPQEYIDGKIFFHRIKSAGFYQVIFKTATGEEFKFEFKQQIIPARSF